MNPYVKHDKNIRGEKDQETSFASLSRQLFLLTETVEDGIRGLLDLLRLGIKIHDTVMDQGDHGGDFHNLFFPRLIFFRELCTEIKNNFNRVKKRTSDGNK